MEDVPSDSDPSGGADGALDALPSSGDEVANGASGELLDLPDSGSEHDAA